MKIGAHIDNDIVLDVTSPHTIATVKRSVIEKVTFVQTAVILRNIAAVNATSRVDLIAILIMEGDQVVTGEMHGRIHEIVVKWWIVLLAVSSLTTIAMKISIAPPGRGVGLMTIASLEIFPVE